jgi:exonuclease SbcD
MARGGRLGGGERDAQTVEPYWVSGTAFPSAHYVALGHLHLTQEIPGAAPIWYCGSPIQVDFGEVDDDKHVLVVEATPSLPAKVRAVKIESGERLAIITGTIGELPALAAATGDAYLRVVVREPARAGLADEVRDRLGERVVEVRLQPTDDTPPARDGARSTRSNRSPHDLFQTFLGEASTRSRRPDASGPPRGVGLRRVPGADDDRLRRRRLLRARRSDRVGQVDRDRRHLLRPLRQRAEV